MRCHAALLLFAAGCSSPSSAAPDAGSDAGPCDGVATEMCAGQVGTFHSQPITVGGEVRYFYLHVPASALGAAAPLLVDFHGTGFTDVQPEEEWGVPEMEAASDALGFIVVRPRSHSYTSAGQTLYQWDLDPADLAGNLALAGQLVDLVSAHYRVAPERVYTAGFSNGTNMALQTLAMAASPFHGIGIVGGGIYEPFAHPVWPDPAPRIYATSGYRDLNYEFQRDMSAWLATNHYPIASLWIRETKALHELRGWQYREMFGWLDAGTRPAGGTAAVGVTIESFPSPDTTLLSLAQAADGHLIASGADGSIWARTASGWTTARAASAQPVLISSCLDGSGGGYATGETSNFTTADDGASWQPAPAVPHTARAPGPASQLFAVDCGPGARRAGGGVAFSASSADGGATWQTGDFGSLVFGVRRGQSGAWIAVGPASAGRSSDAITYTVSDLPAELYDVAEAAPGHWWAVGVDGAIVRSIDDGASWQSMTPVVGDALYAIRFASPTVGMAVGAHGTTIVTQDGGAHWTARPTGLDRMLGDLWWLDAQHAMVVGEHGLVLQLVE